MASGISERVNGTVGRFVVFGILLSGVFCGCCRSQAEELQKAEEPRQTAEDRQPSKEFTNRIGMKFVLIPGGTFLMGSPPDEPGRKADEIQHKVSITRPFYLQTTEVTQGQWKRVFDYIPFSLFYFVACGEGCPVENVSWSWAQEFIRKLNEAEGTDKYSLPTEAQWEYACRAGSTTAYHFGDNDDLLSSYAWYFDNSLSNTHPVGQKKPNGWGLHDMHGNVAEWCQDWYADYPRGHVTDPEGPSTGEHHMFRGGSWDDPAPLLRSAVRNRYVSGGRLNIIGFRVVRDL